MPVAYCQAVLNEIYSLPGSTNHEFFELYNTSTQNVTITTDNYTLVSYFEDGRTSGFYIMDLPNISLPAKGYFVGSAANPFNCQGISNSPNTDFNWNDEAFRNGLTYGYIKKWVAGTNNLNDGNLNYDEEAVPANFNDFFSKRRGGGVSYNAFLFKEGILLNSFLGGSGGQTVIPSFITSMPAIQVQTLTAFGNHDFTINFSNYANIPAENVGQDIGIDNGFIRKNDGMCGTWDKSSAQAFHTPKAPNSSISQMVPTGSLTLETHISRATTPGDSSLITYNITAGSASMFPLELFVYADNGSMDNQWDGNDIYLASATETTVSDGSFTTRFLPQDQELIIVVKTALGCYDQVRLILNPFVTHITLPLSLKMSAAKKTGEQVLLEWMTSENQSADHFVIEKSTDKKNFKAVATVNAAATPGESYYTFTDREDLQTYYRIKVVSKTNTIFYSPVLYINTGTKSPFKQSLLVNTAGHQLNYQFNSDQSGVAAINIYSANGTKIAQYQTTFVKGSNQSQLDIGNQLSAGLYIIEINVNNKRTVQKFIKK